MSITFFRGSSLNDINVKNIIHIMIIQRKLKNELFMKYLPDSKASCRTNCNEQQTLK